MAQLITQAEYARRRGVSREAVRKAIHTERITGIAHNGKVMVDPDVADIQWARNTDSDQQQRGAPEQLGLTQARADQALHHVAGTSPAPAAAGPGSSPDSPHLVRAKTDTEILRKELMELEVAERRGELVPIAHVERAYSAKLAAAKDAFEAIPDRIAAKVAAESDVAAVYRMLLDEIRLAMGRLVGQAPEAIN